MTPFDFRPRTRILFGSGEFSRLGELARGLDGSRCLVIADPGVVSAGHAQNAVRSLKARRLEVFEFHDFEPGPNVAMVDAGAAYAVQTNPNLIVALGGGSSLDFAKAVNLVASCGGSIRDYWGYGNITKPLIPMIGIPTTAGTGSEAQTKTVIFDPQAASGGGSNMICGDPKLAFGLAVLDPKLSLTQPHQLTASSGYEAIMNALESLHSIKRTAISECFGNDAWRLLSLNFERVLKEPADIDARGGMLLGAHLAGLAAEYSSLGAAHACAQPLVKDFKLTRGAASALMLGPVLEWQNVETNLVQRVRHLARRAGLHTSLRDVPVPESTLPRLAEQAVAQWSGRFGPKALTSDAAMEIYQAAW